MSEATGRKLSGATFSACRRYRYKLWRTWDPFSSVAMFIGLNPSTADETKDDPTIRRCIGFAKAWGHGGIIMTNLYAFRATDPSVLWAEPLPIGEENDTFIRSSAGTAKIVVAAWGAFPKARDQGSRIRAIVDHVNPLGVCVLKLTKHGHPAHPLYLRTGLIPKRWLHA